jgi:hypothetical protein
MVWIMKFMIPGGEKLLNYWRLVHMFMFPGVGMKVLVDKLTVTVRVPVNEVGRHQ